VPRSVKLLNELDGKSSIVEKYRKGGLGEDEVGNDLINCVEQAKTSCPVQVISTE
jgi:ferredoxin